MGERKPEDKRVDASNDRVERSDNPPSRANKPGRHPKPVVDEPDAAEIHWDVIRHYFPDFINWLKDVNDPRKKPELCTYPIEYVLITALMMFCGQCGSRRQLGRELNGGKRFGGNIWRLIGRTYADIVCHPDTMNKVMAALEPEQLEELIVQIVGKLRKSRVLDRFRFGGQLVVAVDGTQLMRFKNRHCEHCLYQTKNGKTTYSHYALAAKIVTPVGLVVPFAFEFVENPVGEFDKQDCELKAFRRLVEKIRRLYPRLPITLVGDGLYAEETTLRLGERNDWSVIVTLKEGKLPSVTAQLPPKADDWTGTRKIEFSHHGEKTTRFLRWKNCVRYHGEFFHVVEMEDFNTKGERVYYNRWITNVRTDKGNVNDLALTGRRRWKIENEGINTQKTGGYEMEHGYGLTGDAWKNYYLILQIAQLFNDLVRFGDYIQKVTGDADASFSVVFQTMRNFAKRLIECLRNNTPRFEEPRVARFQIRVRAP